MTLKLIFVSLLMLAALELDIYSAVEIKINPASFSEDEASTVDVSCTVNKDESEAKKITMMKIARKGERDIVLLHQNNSVTYAAGNAEEFPAKGYVYSDVSGSNLMMTITTPDPEDGGVYICHVFFTTDSGEKETKANGHLAVKGPEVKMLNDTIKKLLDKVEEDKDKLKKIEKKESEDKAKVVDLENKANEQTKNLNDLVEKEAEVEKKVNKLEMKTKEQIKEMLQGVDKHPKVKAIKEKVQKILDRIQTEEKDIKTLKEKKEEDKTRVSDLEKTVKQQSETIKGLTQRLSAFEKKIEELDDKTMKKTDKQPEDKNDETKKKVAELKNTIMEHAGKIDDLKDKARKVDDLKDKLNDVKQKLEKSKDDSKKDDSNSYASLVAFHATSGLGNMYPKSGQALRFSQVPLNLGRGYNQPSGTFTAPRSGIYAFHLFLQIPCYGCKMDATIVANNVALSRFSGGNSYDHDQHSVSAVVHLKAGDIVKAIASDVDNALNSQFSLGFMEKSGFNGYLVAPAPDSPLPPRFPAPGFR